MDIDVNNEYKIITSPSFARELRAICNYISYTINEYVIADILHIFRENQDYLKML